MSEKISNSSKRLQEMMDKLSIKQSDIVARTGINKSALSNYLHGTREPRQDQISKIADPYGINPTWLMGYDVPMFMNDTPIIEYAIYDDGKLISRFDLEDITFIKSYKDLDKDAKRQLTLMLAFLKAQEKGKK